MIRKYSHSLSIYSAIYNVDRYPTQLLKSAGLRIRTVERPLIIDYFYSDCRLNCIQLKAISILN